MATVKDPNKDEDSISIKKRIAFTKQLAKIIELSKKKILEENNPNNPTDEEVWKTKPKS